MNNKIYFIVPIVVLIIAMIVTSVISINKDKDDETPIGESQDNNNGEENEPVIPPIYVPADKEDSNEENPLESDEPPVGKDNVDLDVSENLPPEKNPDPTASAGDVIYGTKGEDDGE